MYIFVSSSIDIPRRYVDQKMLDWIKRKLTFKNPVYTNAVYNNAWNKHEIPKYIYGYWENNRMIGMDRGFLNRLVNYLNKRNIRFTIKNRTVRKKLEFSLNSIKLRPYQKRAVQRSLQARGGIIVQPCGAGKTVTLLALLRKLNQHTIIFVHTKFLMEQWRQYIKDFLGYDCGIIQGTTIDIKPITVAMIQTMYQRDLLPKFTHRWGCVMVDEVHHVPAESFQDIITHFPARFRYGVSATVKRSDGLTGMIFSIMGDISYRISSTRLRDLGYIKIPTVRIRNTDFFSSHRKFHSIISDLINDKERNELIIQDLINCDNRFNLVLSSRIQHLENLVELYKQHTDDYDVIVGSVKGPERDNIVNRMRNGELHTIFATQLADEGLDIPNLDTLFLVFPTKSEGRIEQRIGRTQRIYEGKHDPIIYDYDDSWVPSLNRSSMSRVYLYEQLELTIER